MILMMGLMMGLMIVFALAIVLLPILMVSITRNTDGKAKRNDLEKPKRHLLELGDDGELVEIDEEEDLLYYANEEGQ